MSKLLRILFSPKNLLKTNAALGAGLMATGDIIAQDMELNHVFELPIFKMISSTFLSEEQTRQSKDTARLIGSASEKLLSSTLQSIGDGDTKNSPIRLVSGMLDLETLKHLDFKQTGAMATGGLYFGIAGHFWYQFLENRFKNRRRALLKKLIADGMAGPPFAAGLFAVTGTISGHSLSESMHELRSNIWFILAADWLFFVPLQTINFRYLPLKYRLLYVGCITLIYDTFLSHIINSSHQKQ